jgi:hypothetical protein
MWMLLKGHVDGGPIMGFDEVIMKHLRELPESERAEVLDFIDYLKAKTEKKERMDWTAFSLNSALRGFEDEPSPYSLDDIKESFS